MEPHQPSRVVTSPVVVTKTTKLQLDPPVSQSGDSIEASGKKKSLDKNLGAYIGILDFYIHQARDIHNICIYQNQDVYAKLWLTSDPEQTVLTQIINRGGRNPVFNENVRFNVRTIDSSLRCEVWMLSRIRNYLEDQLLGFTLVPLSDVLIENGKLSKEFSLSSSDLFHSPAGFVQLTLTYDGSSPEVMEIPTPQCCSVVDVADKDSGVNDAVPNQLDEIEFPDLDIVDENECMASQYFAIACPSLEAKSTENDDQISPHSHVCIQETVAVDDEVATEVQETVAVDGEVATEVPLQNPSTTFATESSPSVSVPTNSLSGTDASRIPDQSQKVDDVSDSRAGTASEVEEDVKASPFTWPVIKVSVKPEQDVVQQEIIDMYTKSMNQFTEALAKMKLPMDIENGSSFQNGVKSGSSENPNASMDTEPRPKVFYGSRAFF